MITGVTVPQTSRPLAAAARLLALGALCVVNACTSSARPPSMIVAGHVEFLQLEGGCLVFHGDDGTDYLLIAAPEVGLDGVYEDGAFLEVELVLARDVGGYCPGTIAEVLRILSASLPLHGLPGLRLVRTEDAGGTDWRVEPVDER